MSGSNVAASAVQPIEEVGRRHSVAFIVGKVVFQPFGGDIREIGETGRIVCFRTCKQTGLAAVDGVECVFLILHTRGVVGVKEFERERPLAGFNGVTLLTCTGEGER